MRRSSLLATAILILALGMLAVVIAGKPDPALLRQPLVISGLQPMGVASPSWQTMVIYASRDVALPRDQLYAAFEKVETWPQWARPLVVEARWVDLPGWRAGARFQQTVDLGFPFHRLQSDETVGSATPGRVVSWWSEKGGIKSNHTWSFEDLPQGGTRVVNLEIFHGPLIGVARLFFEQTWQERFDAAIDGLVTQARRSGG